ncbi:hypothetical protein [Streptomyces sp. NPDC051452]|uniref:hypothetical protein n=1 Tax=Streptomyces sp. NPDC051452 TaxID=3365654 RepID=UPI00379BE434
MSTVEGFGHVAFVRRDDGTEGVLKSPRPNRGSRKVSDYTLKRYREEVLRMEERAEYLAAYLQAPAGHVLHHLGHAARR